MVSDAILEVILIFPSDLFIENPARNPGSLHCNKLYSGMLIFLLAVN